MPDSGDQLLRPLRLEDAPELWEVAQRNQEFLAPWEPLRNDDSEAAHQAHLRSALDNHARGIAAPHVIRWNGHIVGRFNLNSIIRGAFQSASVGYWIDQEHNGLGLTTRALAEGIRVAFADLGLHRLQGETLERNRASQRVLEKNGFTFYGTADHYLRIAGRWQTCRLYQLINPDWHD